MSNITITEIIDDLRVSEEVLRKFERRYWITSEQFYELYSQGLLDNGDHTDDFSEWAGSYKLKMRRESVFQELSKKRLDNIKTSMKKGIVQLEPQEPAVEVV